VQAGCTEFVPLAREAFRELCQSNDVYLITTVSGEEEAERVRAFYEGSGLHDDGLDRRKVLFCQTNKGRESMARQIEPAVHIDSDRTIVGALRPHLKACWLVSAACPARTENGNVTEAPSLQTCIS